MSYSHKKETGHESPKDKSTNKNKSKKLRDNTHPLYPHRHPDMNQPPRNLSHPFIIYNNKTMDTESLVQIRQSNKCGSVRNDQIFNLHLGYGASLWVSIFCLLQDTSHIYWFHPTKQLTSKKQRTQKSDSTPNKSYRTALVYVEV